VPYPSDDTTVTTELPTFGDALVAKDDLLRATPARSETRTPINGARRFRR
jgi:hypothetical protein